jgi:uncharacterized UPF0160 family protein
MTLDQKELPQLAKDASQAPVTLITHSGMYHADDVFTYAVLQTVFPNHALIRTRDEALINGTENVIVFDVGGVFDAEKNRFDHHQPGRPEREDGIPYSSFGLIWKHYGMDYLRVKVSDFDLADEKLIELWESIDRLAYEIDALDNGKFDDPAMLNPNHISRAITWGAPASRDENVMKASFITAADMAGHLLKGKVLGKAKALSDEVVVHSLVAKNGDKNWIELPEGLSFNKVLAEPENRNLLYVILPEMGGAQWCLIALKSHEGNFQSRKELPESWAGLRDEDLQKATKTDDAIFCHLGRFFAVAKSRESIMRMLWTALED